jgi:hypothetical protein|tara:strand:+ start:5025 stop:5138 length:114 start_codon:yes stop_codon:yes gene_type:complete
MSDREIVRCLRGDSEWKVGRSSIGMMRRMGIFERVKK